MHLVIDCTNLGVDFIHLVVDCIQLAADCIHLAEACLCQVVNYIFLAVERSNLAEEWTQDCIHVAVTVNCPCLTVDFTHPTINCSHLAVE